MYYDEDYCDEDFYDRSLEFEEEIHRLKIAMSDAIKKEFLNKMHTLEEENERLQYIEANFNKIKEDFKQKERQLEIERENLRRSIRQERLSELTKDAQVVLYSARSKYVYPPKCNKCDENRQIKYNTPLGNTAYERCNCNKSKVQYSPHENIRVEFSIRHGQPHAFYDFKEDRNGDNEYMSLDSKLMKKENLYEEGMDYEGMNPYNSFFRTKEECQNFCDYLNKHGE